MLKNKEKVFFYSSEHLKHCLLDFSKKLSSFLISKFYTLISFLTVSILISSYLFALDLSSSEKLYLSYFENSSQFGNYVRQSIYHDLPLYRYFKIYFVGSAEMSENAKKTGDYLLSLKPFENVNSDEEALARSIFLTYWEAKLNFKAFNEELIKNSPIYNEFFSQYQSRVTEAVGNFLQDLTAYLFGVDLTNHIENIIPDKLLALRKNIITNFNYDSVYNNEEREAIEILIKKENVIETISQIINEAQQEAEKKLANSENIDAEILVLRTRGLIFRRIYADVAGLKDEIAGRFVKITSKDKNFGWLRWVVYIFVFVTWYSLFKNFRFPLTLLIASETIYIGSFFNIQSNVDGMIYGLLFGIFILFSIAYYTYKKNYFLAIISLLTLAFLFIPTLFTEDLIMKNSFTSSPFYEALFNDIFKDPLGIVQKNLKNFNSITNDSIQNFSNLLYELGEESNAPEEAFQQENFESRLAFAKELYNKFKRSSKEIEKLKSIDDFIYFENGRKKKLEKILYDSEKLFVKIASNSSDDFTNRVIAFIENNYPENTSKRFIGKINNTKKNKLAFIASYKVRTVLVATILLSTALFLNALKLTEAFIPLVGSISVSFLALLKTQEIFVQVGVPVITVYSNIVIPFTLVLSLFFTFIWLRENNIIRRRERV